MVNKVIAVDLGGTYLRVSLVQNNKILKYIKKPTPKKKKAIIKLLCNCISDLIFNINKKELKGIGIGSVGPLTEDGTIKNTPNLPLNNVNFKKILSKKFKIRTEIENDANCVALAESKLGSAKTKKNFIVLTIGTGIGGGIIIDKKLYKGRGNAGELGHIILNNSRTFEDLAAAKKHRRITKRNFSKVLLINELIEMSKSKEKQQANKAKMVLSEITLYLGQGIASLINIFDPEVVILAGGVRESGEPFLKMIKEEVRKYVIFPTVPEIKWSKLRHPGTSGAALLID